LSAASELPQEEHRPPPEQEAAVVDHQGLEASVRKLVEPLGEVRPEVANRPDEGGGDVYGRPRFLF
jgi:hypothetical protein